MAIEIKRTQKVFRDISLSFIPHPLTGDLTVLTDERAINAAIKNILFTRVGERQFSPLFGSSIHDALFNFNDEVTANEVLDEIERAINFNEPRIDLLELNVDPIPNSETLDVLLKYRIIGYDQVFSFNTILTPTR